MNPNLIPLTPDTAGEAAGPVPAVPPLEVGLPEAGQDVLNASSPNKVSALDVVILVGGLTAATLAMGWLQSRKTPEAQALLDAQARGASRSEITRLERAARAAVSVGEHVIAERDRGQAPEHKNPHSVEHQRSGQ